MFSKTGQITYCGKPVFRILLKLFLFHSILTKSLLILTISDIILRLSHLLWNITASDAAIENWKKENDSKDHYVEFISKYLSSFL